MADLPNQEQVLKESPGDNAELSDLLAAVVGQDKLAFETLYNATVDRLYGLALRISQSRDLAEDILSDVYLQVWQQASRYSPERGSVMAWLSTICRSRALDRVRKRQSVAEKEESVENDRLEDAAVVAQDLLVLVEQDSALHHALLSLDAASRQLLALAYFKDYSHSELSQLTGKPIGTVKTQIRRAIIELNKVMCRESQNPGVTYE